MKLYDDEKAFDQIAVYPIIISEKENDGFHLVTIPDFAEHTVAMTAGRSIAEAMYMARDYIMIVCEHLQEQGTPLPAPSPMETIEHKPGDIITLIDAELEKESVPRKKRELLPGLSALAAIDKDEYFAKIDRGIADIEAGNSIVKTMGELRAMENMPADVIKKIYRPGGITHER